MAPKLDLRFLIDISKSSVTGEYGKFTASVVFVEEDKVRWPSGTWSGSFEAPYADLKVTAQCNLRDDRGAGWYALEFGYVDGTYAVDLRRAEVMVKTLRRLQAKLDKLAVEFGNANDLPTFLTRVASSLGIKLYALRDSYTGDRYGQPMAQDYRWTDTQGILYALASASEKLGVTV